MKTSIQTLISAVMGGLLSYFIARTSLITYLWLTNTQLTGNQRYLIHQQSDIVFLVGAILGLTAFLIKHKLKSQQQ